MKKNQLFILAVSGMFVVALVTGFALKCFSPSEGNTGLHLSTAAYAAGSNDDAGKGNSEISVSGAGSINVNPDVAYVSL